MLPIHIAVNGKVLAVMHVFTETMPRQNYDILLVGNVITREVMRVTNLNKIHQVMIKDDASSIIKQVTSLTL